jgi:hypothetical protein
MLRESAANDWVRMLFAQVVAAAHAVVLSKSTRSALPVSTTRRTVTDVESGS